MTERPNLGSGFIDPFGGAIDARSVSRSRAGLFALAADRQGLEGSWPFARSRIGS